MNDAVATISTQSLLLVAFLLAVGDYFEKCQANSALAWRGERAHALQTSLWVSVWASQIGRWVVLYFLWSRAGLLVALLAAAFGMAITSIESLRPHPKSGHAFVVSVAAFAVCPACLIYSYWLLR